MNIDIKSIAIQTIKTEAAAIEKLAGFIDDDFEKTVSLIYNGKGRVIVSGITLIERTISLIRLAR